MYMAKSNEVILRVENLQKSYDGKKAVDGISFEVKKGEIFGILGPNGAGKTTTLEMIEDVARDRRRHRDHSRRRCC